jgi:putative oxygen-independent coproporphyrinogen III oxidase
VARTNAFKPGYLDLTSHFHPRPERFALYVHVPFCVRKCPYCAFISQELEDPSFADAFVDSTLREAVWHADRDTWKSSSAHSLFLGGGTPSMLGSESVKRLIHGLHQQFQFTDDAECSIEVNPGTLKDELLTAWAEAGINRVSLGVQSLGTNTLKKLGRIHHAEQARESWEKLRDFGAFRMNIDLMYGIVAEDAMNEWQATLDEVASWKPDHLSAYSLIVEDGTPFAAMQATGKQVRLDDDDELEQMQMLSRSMQNIGLNHYEVSNWSKQGYQCRHNLSYWDGGSYLSLGPAAHSYDATKRLRYWNIEDTKKWMSSVSERGHGVEGEEMLSPRQHLEERIMLNLRMVEGGPEEELYDLADKAGLTWPPKGFDTLIDQGMLERTGNSIRCTERGFYLVDAIQAQLAAGLTDT